MKTLVLCAFTLAAASAAVLAGACSSDDTSTSDGSGDSGTSSTPGTSGTSGTPATPSAAPVADKDTCRPAGGSCQCSCAVTGQTEDKTKHCPLPAQDTGLCPQVCCTGEPSTTSSSSGSSGVVDAGDSG